MPFIGKDWRSDGEQWIKTDIGSWEPIKRGSSSNCSFVNINSSLSDIFNSLDIANSVSNVQRFNYITKVVQILFKEKLSELSGNAQRALFQVLQRMVDTVIKSGDKVSLMQRLVTQFHDSIQRAYPYFYYIGSSELWRQHINVLVRMQDELKQVRFDKLPNDDNDNKKKVKLTYLPNEIQREIIRRLDDGNDLIHIGMINSNLYHVTKELNLWRQLCIYHFGDQTQNTLNEKFGEKILGLIRRERKLVEFDDIDWKNVYFKLKRQNDLRETYSEMIHQCQLCKCLFWQNCQHRCLYETLSSSSKPIMPKKLVNMLIH